MYNHRHISQKKLGDNTVLTKFCNACPNHDFLVLYEFNKKFGRKYKVRTKKKVFYYNFVFDLLSLVPKKTQ